jgi:ketosteroid isomerase-like protein
VRSPDLRRGGIERAMMTRGQAARRFRVAGSGKATVETLQRVVDAFNAHDLDAVMSFFTDDPVLELPRGPHPWGQRFEGPEEVRAGLASRFAGIPDVHYGDDRHWVSGNRGCSEWLLLTGTTVQGVRLEVRGCDLWEFEGDKIARKDSYWKLVER